ncbi:MAG TPA: hypothetical protein VGN72_00255 [Tepidisphaeraceae bacterium]|jgi:hypothetical protein|nr:hypothetical protein [Tepidisphaeraceae bacterium]
MIDWLDYVEHINDDKPMPATPTRNYWLDVVLMEEIIGWCEDENTKLAAIGASFKWYTVTIASAPVSMVLADGAQVLSVENVWQ